MAHCKRNQLSWSILTYQYPDFRLSEENHKDPCRLSRVSSIQGSKKASLTVQLFNFLRSIQILRPPSFFQTNTTVLAHRCMISAWHWCQAFPGDWLSCHHTHAGIFTGSTLWKASYLFTQYDVWSEMSFPGLGHCGQTDAPISSAISWPDSTPPNPVGPIYPGSTLPGIMAWLSLSFHGGLPVASGWHWWLFKPWTLW